jgi:UDP:flavonoid glycosyltransferase YjiC (YdhE family)
VLVHGVPQVAIAFSNDQPGIAARIAEKKTGLFVPLRDLSAPRLAGLLNQVLSDGACRGNTRGAVGEIMNGRLSFSLSRNSGPWDR